MQKIVIIGVGRHAHIPDLLTKLPKLPGLIVMDEVIKEKDRTFEFKPIHDMGEVIELVKRSKTAQHKELMRKGRREFHKK